LLYGILAVGNVIIAVVLGRRRRFGRFGFFFSERDPRVDQATGDTDIDSYEVDYCEEVITSDEHAHVRDGNVLQTADDGCRQRRVVLGAEENGIGQDESHDARG